MNPPKLLLCSLAFASILRGRGVGAFARPFAADYSALQDQIERLCLPNLKDDATLTKATTLKQLIKTDDYVGRNWLERNGAIIFSQYRTTAEWVLEALCATYPDEPVAPDGLFDMLAFSRAAVYPALNERSRATCVEREISFNLSK